VSILKINKLITSSASQTSDPAVVHTCVYRTSRLDG
jgi:hypothetical protein